MKGNYLITTDGWFIAPDGSQYQAVWGNCEVLDDSMLGVKTNAKSTNWFVKVGNEKSHVIIGGCQIHYAVKCEKPFDGKSKSWSNADGKFQEYDTPCRIYFPEDQI